MGYLDFEAKDISIHAPTKGATSATPAEKFEIQNFNPRSHEGSDRINIILPLGTIISIHAPTKGATSPWIKHTDVPDISIHAPTKGATQDFTADSKDVKVFQSTLPRRERPIRCPPT